MKRDYVIIYFRVFAMLMIVLFHCYCYNLGVWPFLRDISQPYNYYISPRILSTIGLSLFVVISGYLYGHGVFQLSKYNDSIELIKRKFLRLILPYSIWALITYVIFYTSVYWKQLFGGIAHLWFLLMLFNCFLFAALTKSVWRRLECFSFIVLITLLFLLTFLCDNSILNRLWFFSINRTVPWLYVFFIGIFLGKYNVFQRLHSYMGNSSPPRWILFLDRNSMGVYILHHTFIWIAIYYSSSISNLIMFNPICAPWILFIIVLSISLVCANYIGKLKYSIYVFG